MQPIRRVKKNEILFGEKIGLNGLIEDAKSKSELAGIDHVLQFPQRMVDTLQEDIAELRADLQAESEANNE